MALRPNISVSTDIPQIVVKFGEVYRVWDVSGAVWDVSGEYWDAITSGSPPVEIRVVQDKINISVNANP